VENRIKCILDGLGVEYLYELDPVAVDRFLTDLARKKKHSGITRNEYIASIKSFTKWAVTFRRMKDDLLAGLRVSERRGMEPAHPRRALSMDEIARLLEAAERRALIELQTIRIGPCKGKAVAKVKPHTKAKALRKGRERKMVYMLAVWTGLRRNEIRQLTWGDIHLDTIPGHIVLRARTTKSKRADSLPIHEQLAGELKIWRPRNAGPGDRVVSTVPHMKTLRADLALAGIAYKDEGGRYVDFHSLRVSLSTMLAAHKVSPRAAQALMRHTDPRLTAAVYTDERLLPLAAELQNVPAIPLREESGAIDLLATGTDG
jgi:integrase